MTSRNLKTAILAAAALFAVPLSAFASVPDPIPVPEPSIAVLLAAGAIAGAAVRKYRREP